MQPNNHNIKWDTKAMNSVIFLCSTNEKNPNYKSINTILLLHEFIFQI